MHIIEGKHLGGLQHCSSYYIDNFKIWCFWRSLAMGSAIELLWFRACHGENLWNVPFAFCLATLHTMEDNSILSQRHCQFDFAGWLKALLQPSPNWCFGAAWAQVAILNCRVVFSVSKKNSISEAELLQIYRTFTQSTESTASCHACYSPITQSCYQLHQKLSQGHLEVPHSNTRTFKKKIAFKCHESLLWYILGCPPSQYKV